MAIAVAGALLLLVAAPVYGVPTVEHAVSFAAGIVLGSVAFVSGGVVLGTLLPSARSAQAVGLLLFFPSFLLGVGGPPPAVMSPALRSLTDVLPLAMVKDAIRSPWLGLEGSGHALPAVVVLAMITTALAMRRATL